MIVSYDAAPVGQSTVDINNRSAASRTRACIWVCLVFDMIVGVVAISGVGVSFGSL